MDEIEVQLAILAGVAAMAPTERGGRFITSALGDLEERIRGLYNRAEAAEKWAAELAEICDRRWDLLRRAAGYVACGEHELVKAIQAELDGGVYG